MARRKSHQLKNRRSPGEVKVSNKLSDLKPLHAKLAVKMNHYFKQQKDSIIKGFEKAGIMGIDYNRDRDPQSWDPKNHNP